MRRRGHFARGDAVMNFDPGGEVIRVGRFVAEFGEVEPCGGRGGVVAGGAVLLNEGVGAGEGWTGGHAGSGEKSGDQGDTRREGQLQDVSAVTAGSTGRDLPGLQAGNPRMLLGHTCGREFASER